MDITVLYVDDCPHVELARQRVVEALDRLGSTVVPTERLITCAGDAGTAGFHGSPTILVDGMDPFPTTEASGLSCRMYPTNSGMEGAPSVDQLVEVFTR